jgi:hypothetical protein
MMTFAAFSGKNLHMRRVFTAGIGIMIVAEGVLVAAAPLLALLFSLALLASSVHLWYRRSRGRRPSASRRAWTSPDARPTSALHRAA